MWLWAWHWRNHKHKACCLGNNSVAPMPGLRRAPSVTIHSWSDSWGIVTTEVELMAFGAHMKASIAESDHWTESRDSCPAVRSDKFFLKFWNSVRLSSTGPSLSKQATTYPCTRAFLLSVSTSEAPTDVSLEESRLSLSCGHVLRDNPFLIPAPYTYSSHTLKLVEN